MWMEFADYIANGPRRFFKFCTRLQPQLGHRVDDSTLYRLQTIAYVRQSTIVNYIHRIVQVGLLRISL